MDGAKFCPYCGTESKTQIYCSICGAKLYPGAKFCGICRTEVKHPGTGRASGVPQVRKPAPASFRTGSMGTILQRIREDRIIQIRIITVAFVVGVCLMAFGLFGKIMIGHISAEAAKAGGMPPSMFNNYITALIKGDTDRLFQSELLNLISYGSFESVRWEMKQELGVLWPLVYMMGINSELLIIGLLITAGAVVFWIRIKGNPAEVKKEKIRFAIYVGAGVVTTLIVCAILGLSTIDNYIGTISF